MTERSPRFVLATTGGWESYPTVVDTWYTEPERHPILPFDERAECEMLVLLFNELETAGCIERVLPIVDRLRALYQPTLDALLTTLD